MSENGWTTYTIPTTPDRALSPNSRVHWRAKHSASRAQRNIAALAVAHSGVEFTPVEGRSILVEYDVRWGRRRKKMDDDNLIAALKPMRDGIADALGVDDARWITMRVTQSTGHDQGEVVVRLAVGGL